MTTAALLRLAWRESRTARQTARALHVLDRVRRRGAGGHRLVRTATSRSSIRDQSRTLLGGDISLSARAEFPQVIDTLLDSLDVAGTPSARITTFPSMALAEPSGYTRLVQVRAVSPGYPFYGVIETVPAGGWATVHDSRVVFVDPSLLIALECLRW